MTNIQFDINRLLGKIQSVNDERVTYTQLADAIGKKRYTVQAMAANESFQDLLAMLAAMIDFANAKGYPATIDDVITVTNEPEPKTSSPNIATGWRLLVASHFYLVVCCHRQRGKVQRETFLVFFVWHIKQSHRLVFGVVKVA